MSKGGDADEDRDQCGGQGQEGHDLQAAAQNRRAARGVEPLDRLRIESRPDSDHEDVADPLPQHRPARRLELLTFASLDDLECTRLRTAEIYEDHHGEDHEADHQDHALEHIGPGHRPKAAERLINDHDESQGNDRPEVNIHISAGAEPLDRAPHGHQLGEKIVRQGDDHHHRGQHRQRPIGEAVVQVIYRGDKTANTGARLELRSQQQVEDDHRRHEVNAHRPGVTDPVGLAGEAEERVAAVLGGVEGQHQHDEAKATSGEVEVLHRVFPPRPVAQPADQQERAEIEGYEHPGARTEWKQAFVHSSSEGQGRLSSQAV